MGKIFSFDEIEKHIVPKRDSFFYAKQIVLSSLDMLHREGNIYGAKVFGSVAKGTPNFRSDFDIVIVTETENIPLAIGDVIQSVYERTFVGIEPIIIPKIFATNGLHTIDPQLLDHISRVKSEGNVVGSDPCNILKPPDISPSKDFEEYLLQKLRRLREGMFVRSAIERDRILQRTLEAPTNVGRKALQTLGHLGDDDSKEAVIQSFQNTFHDGQLVKGFRFLLEKNSEYNHLLEGALKGQVGRVSYESSISMLASESIAVAIEWVSELALLKFQIGEGNKISSEGRPHLGGKET